MMRALVFGPTGQVGTELLRGAKAREINVTAIDENMADFTKPDACAEVVRAAEVDIIVNAAAYTAVDNAEDERDLAFLINGATPGALARVAAGRQIPFLHISTDYVFEGLPGDPLSEDDPVGPNGAYGQSKLAGEETVLAAKGDAVILRTAWVFSAHGNNFVKTMLKYGKTNDVMRVVEDQFGAPTAARDIADALWTIAEAYRAGKGKAGIYHYTGAPSTHWADFARAIFETCGWDKKPEVKGITTEEWPTKTQRPANSVLNCQKIQDVYGISQPDWRKSLRDVVTELKEA